VIRKAIKPTIIIKSPAIVESFPVARAWRSIKSLEILNLAVGCCCDSWFSELFVLTDRLATEALQEKLN
jgi:hypothetical protein